MNPKKFFLAILLTACSSEPAFDSASDPINQPGKKIGGEPCTSGAECSSGACTREGWCYASCDKSQSPSQACSFSVLSECVNTTMGSSSGYCFPICGSNSDCTMFGVGAFCKLDATDIWGRHVSYCVKH